VPRGFCPQHAEQHQEQQRLEDARRGSPGDRLYTSEWRRAAGAFLRTHQHCVACAAEGRITVARVVDHIRPHRGDQKLFWDESNWQPLCRPCHSVKTAKHDGGFNNPRSVQ